jgi:hypothetical protein
MSTLDLTDEGNRNDLPFRRSFIVGMRLVGL